MDKLTTASATADDFRALLNAEFVIRIEKVNPITLELNEVTDLGRPISLAAAGHSRFTSWDLRATSICCRGPTASSFPAEAQSSCSWCRWDRTPAVCATR